jgi:WD40 repeat protein
MKSEGAEGRLLATWIAGGSYDRRMWRLPRPHSRAPLEAPELVRLPTRHEYYKHARFTPARTGVALWRDHALVDGWVDTLHDVRVVEVETGALRGTTIRHSARVRDVTFTPDGRYFATCGDDSTARVWEAATGRPAGPILPHRNHVAGVTFSPDGKVLAAGDYGPGGLIKLWDWRTGKETRPPLRHDDIVLNVAFSPDGKYLVANKWGGGPRNRSGCSGRWPPVRSSPGRPRAPRLAGRGPSSGRTVGRSPSATRAGCCASGRSLRGSFWASDPSTGPG